MKSCPAILFLLCAALTVAATLSPKQTQFQIESGAVPGSAGVSPAFSPSAFSLQPSALTDTVSSLTVTTTSGDAFTFFIRSSNNWVQVSLDCINWQNFCQLTAHVELAWNPSPQQISGYNLYVGTNSGVYSLACSSTNNAAAIFGLIQGATYYFAATYYDANGTNSPYSSEVVYTIPFIPPKFNRP